MDQYDDVIDSREVIDRITELELIAADGDALLDQAERVELEDLRKLAAEAAGYASDWVYGETLIRATYFREYAQELAAETCDPDASKVVNDWPYRHIDWDAAADELSQDYTTVDFAGVAYWVRAS